MSQENVEIVRSRGRLPISDRQLRRLLRYPGALAPIFRLVVLVPRRMSPQLSANTVQTCPTPLEDTRGG
jgi:hypothetical protein